MTQIDFKELVKTAKVRERWFKYEPSRFPGLEFLVSYIPKAELSRIVDKNTVHKWSRRTRRREEETDPQGVAGDFALRAFKGWRGFRFQHLKSMVPTEAPANGVTDDTEIPFDADLAVLLVREAYDLDQWLQEIATDIGAFSDAAPEEVTAEVKN